MNNRQGRKEGELEFRILLALTLPIFLVDTLVRRAMPWNWGRDKRPLLATARCAAHNALPFAFM